MSALWTALAQLHLEQDDWSAARHALSRAFIEDPSDANSLILSTFISTHAADTKDAESTFARRRGVESSSAMSN